jgi:hypothetical protein
VALRQELESLDLSVNAFRGTIPTDIRRLRSLRYLALGVNVLYGTLPSELGELTLLERFDIDGGFNPETNVLIQSWCVFMSPPADSALCGKWRHAVDSSAARLPASYGPRSLTL